MTEAASANFSTPVRRRDLSDLSQIQKPTIEKQAEVTRDIALANRRRNISIIALAIVGALAVAGGTYLLATTGLAQTAHFASGATIASVGALASVALIIVVNVRTNKAKTAVNEALENVKNIELTREEILAAMENEFNSITATDEAQKQEQLAEARKKVAASFRALKSIITSEEKESVYEAFFKHIQTKYFGQDVNTPIVLSLAQGEVLSALTDAYETIAALKEGTLSSKMAHHLLDRFSITEKERFTEEETQAFARLVSADKEANREEVLKKHPQAVAHFSVYGKEGPEINKKLLFACYGKMDAVEQSKVLSSLNSIYLSEKRKEAEEEVIKAILNNIHECISRSLQKYKEQKKSLPEILLKELAHYPEPVALEFMNTEISKNSVLINDIYGAMSEPEQKRFVEALVNLGRDEEQTFEFYRDLLTSYGTEQLPEVAILALARMPKFVSKLAVAKGNDNGNICVIYTKMTKEDKAIYDKGYLSLEAQLNPDAFKARIAREFSYFADLKKKAETALGYRANLENSLLIQVLKTIVAQDPGKFKEFVTTNLKITKIKEVMYPIALDILESLGEDAEGLIPNMDGKIDNYHFIGMCEHLIAEANAAGEISEPRKILMARFAKVKDSLTIGMKALEKVSGYDKFKKIADAHSHLVYLNKNA